MTEKKHESFDKLIQAMAQVYRDDTADGMFAGGYEKQRLNPAFIKMMTINCMVMDSLHQCGKGGCKGCVADDLYLEVWRDIDHHTRGIINETRRIIARKHGIAPRVLDNPG